MKTRIGDCHIAEPPANGYAVTTERGTVITPLKLKVTAEASGDLVVEEEPQDPSDDYPRRWTGRIAPDLHVSISRSKLALCDGKGNPFEVIYSGNVVFKKRWARMKLQGVEQPCPDDDCHFSVIFDVKKKIEMGTPKETKD